MTTSSPATTRLDLPVDLHSFTDDLVWGYLDDARDPELPRATEPSLGNLDHRAPIRADATHPAPGDTNLPITPGTGLTERW